MRTPANQEEARERELKKTKQIQRDMQNANRQKARNANMPGNQSGGSIGYV